MFTRSGDDGKTSIANKKVGKDSPVVELLGDIDELNSHIGYAITRLSWEDMKEDLQKIQVHLFEVGEDIASDSKKKKIDESYVKWIEERTLAYRKESGPVKLFVIPGGSEEASLLHITRTVCRRVERNMVRYSKEIEELNKQNIVYLNRLSSLLFAMALVANKRKNVQEKYYDIGKFW
ncbi:ATP--cobalamin adenosyltransferase [Sulfolobus acidocaldarius SUSAZ]|nr:ATP--cobalamin adenosyltransferase [Sulfolobus acidocaldarius SUSAZ]